MRLGQALIGTCVALAAFACPSGVRAQDKPDDKLEAPLPPVSEARPPLPPAPAPEPVPWHNHLEFGGGLAVSELLTHTDGSGMKTPIRFHPAPGFHLDLSWQVFRWLRFTGYLQEHDHGMDLPQGSLMLPAGTITVPASSQPGWPWPSRTAHMYTFGVRFSPTLPIGSRGRLWLTIGVGWGRIEYPRFAYTDSNGPATIRERSATLFEVPFGLGGSFTIIPRWLSIHAEVTGSFIPSQSGDALDQSAGQFIDGSGNMRNLGPMPKLDAAFTETIGLSLHL
jgi:hypothetical protein